MSCTCMLFAPLMLQCFGRRAGIYGAGLPHSPQGVPSTDAGSAQDSADAQFWRQSGLQLGGRETNMQQRLDYAPASDTEALLKKLGAVATASGVRYGLQLLHGEVVCLVAH